MLLPIWQKITLFNPVAYLISGFRWSFYGVADVHLGISVGMTLLFLALCLTAVWWIFKTRYRAQGLRVAGGQKWILARVNVYRPL